MNPTGKNLQTSTCTACFLSFANRRSFCLIGHAVLLTSRACSASSLGTPGISDWLHAKLLVLSWRKLVSASCYLGSRSAPMVTSLDASGRLRQTLFTTGTGSRVVVVRFYSGTSKVVWLILAA
jgi:hypothetical protein